MATLKQSDPFLAGGWFCFGKCDRFVDVDMDRECTVCARCHQPTVRYHAPGGVKTVVKVKGRQLSAEEAHEFFERIRAAIA